MSISPQGVATSHKRPGCGVNFDPGVLRQKLAGVGGKVFKAWGSSSGELLLQGADLSQYFSIQAEIWRRRPTAVHFLI